MKKYDKVMDGLRRCMPITKEDAKLTCGTCPYYGCHEYRSVSLPIKLIEDMRSLLEYQNDEILKFIGEVAKYEALKAKWKMTIADNQLANAPDEEYSESENRYRKGVYDGLQMAYEIIGYDVPVKEVQMEKKGRRKAK